MGKKLFSLFFILFISSFFFLHIINEDVYFSDQENRILTQKPSFSWDSIISSKFTKETEQYVSDQFPLKNGWVGVKGKIEKSLGKKESNGVLFGLDGYLFERVLANEEQLKKNVELVRRFASNPEIKQTYLLTAPTSIEVYPEKLPPYVSSLSQATIVNQMKEEAKDAFKIIDPTKQLIDSKNEAIYFKTDHHWTMRGAYKAYELAAKQMGFQALPIDAFTLDIASKNFYGTLYSKALAYDAEPDNIELFIPEQDGQVEVRYTDGRISKTLFQRSHLNEKDQYAVFLDGNHSLIQIQTGQTTGRKLAVLKDSYAHAFIPFLVAHFDEIHVFDLRYYKQTVTDYLTEHDIDEVLFLYNIPNFMKDTSLGILR